MDQNSNDYKKTMEYGIKLGMKNFIIFGAFGNRLDHTISVISISEQLMQKYEEVNILLVGKKSFMCILRGGYKHAISFSNDFERKGCGIVSFERV
jgi:thiamine pyrophosphokinase